MSDLMEIKQFLNIMGGYEEEPFPIQMTTTRPIT